MRDLDFSFFLISLPIFSIILLATKRGIEVLSSFIFVFFFSRQPNGGPLIVSYLVPPFFCC